MVDVSTHSFAQKLLRPALAIALLAGGMSAVIAAPAHAQDSALLSTSTVVPADVVVYAEVELDSESTQLQMFDDVLTRLGSEESLIDALAEGTQALDTEIDLDGAEIAIGVLPSALTAGASASDSIIGDLSGGLGEVADDVSNVGTASDGEGIVVVVKPQDINALETQIESETGSSATSEQYSGYEIYTTADEGDSDLTVYSVAGDYLFLGSTVDDVKAFIDASADGGASLATVDEFQTASDLLPQERVAFAFANGSAIIDSISKSTDASAEIIDEATASFSGYTALAVSADEPGLRFETVTLPESGSADAVASGLAADLDMADRVPADTSVFAAGYDLGQTTVLRSAGLLLVVGFAGISTDTFNDPAATPVPVSVDDMYQSVAALVGFNLKTDFLDQLSGPYGFAIWGVESGVEDPSSIGAVLVSDVTDPETVDNTVVTIASLVQAAAQGQVSVGSRNVEGGTVNNVEFESDGVQLSIDFGVVGEEFVIGLGDGATVIFGGPTESLADSTNFQTALSYLPDEYQAIYYVNLAQLSGIASQVDPSGMADSDMVAGSTAQSFASVTHVTDGYVHTSAILVVP